MNWADAAAEPADGIIAAMATLPLSPDELLTTTRTVRKRLDLDRPVPMDLVRECIEIALQAPSARTGRAGNGSW